MPLRQVEHVPAQAHQLEGEQSGRGWDVLKGRGAEGAALKWRLSEQRSLRGKGLI